MTELLGSISFVGSIFRVGVDDGVVLGVVLKGDDEGMFSAIFFF